MIWIRAVGWIALVSLIACAVVGLVVVFIKSIDHWWKGQ